ncbi:MAG: arsenite methyltransferase [bacterium]|nr:arsenite methyltransferase [bacterium]
MKENAEQIKKLVQDGYAKIAEAGSSCCCSGSCCSASPTADSISKSVGYNDAEMNSVPEGSNLGLGCGNPVAIASLCEGDKVLDLGSGAGFDAFLASRKVGKTGKVTGIDMTPAMIARAQENAHKGNYQNVEFRLGEIEKLPLEDNNFDVIISNCVINLSPDKEQVFREAFRVLKPGGRLMVSDLVLTGTLPEAIKNSVAAYVGCLSGAIAKETYIEAIKLAGFKNITVIDQVNYPIEAMANDATAQAVQETKTLGKAAAKSIADVVASVKISALKPV